MSFIGDTSTTLAPSPLRSAVMSREHLPAAIIYALAALILFATAPHDGEFWYSDAPRHALNGVFVKDLVETFPSEPSAWAMEYYLRYPALTILLYPPLFYAISAPFYAVFGVSHATALSVVLIHYFALALGLNMLARRWLPPIAAFAVGLSIMASPEAALWGRQVMLDIPSLAFCVWAIVALGRYADTKKPLLLYLAVALALCAAYTKISGAFLFPVIALILVSAHGREAWRDRHRWIAALFAAVALVPLVVLTIEFGGANVRSVVDVGNAEASRTTLEGWLWYARQFPALMGWPLLLPAIVALVLLRFRLPAAPTRTDLVLLTSWFVIGYVFFSLIDLKDARHALFFLPPMLIAAGLVISTLVPRRIGEGTLLTLVVVLGIYTWREYPVPSVTGYRAAAEWIAEHADKNAIVAFSGERDGSFVFNLRTMESRPDVTTLRTDKLLLSVAVSRDLGVQQKSYSEVEIAALLDRDGVSYIVAQDDFWTDIPAMARLGTVLRSSHFEDVQNIPVVATVPTRDRMLRIYRNLGEVNADPGKIELDLPIVGRTVSGNL